MQFDTKIAVILKGVQQTGRGTPPDQEAPASSPMYKPQGTDSLGREVETPPPPKLGLQPRASNNGRHQN